MSEQSVSQIANERRERDHEASRKAVSPNQGKQNPNTNWGRKEQRETSVGKNQLNLGSNRNADRVHESEVAPEHQPSGAFGYSKDQTVRKHEPAPVVEKGAIDNRKVKESTVAERHVQSDAGFRIAERRSASVAQNRKETEKGFADRRKRSSVNR